jgi:predicted Na+-dependent transporter
MRTILTERVTPYRGTVTNWTFFFLFYTLVGLNRDLLLGHASIIFPIATILIITTFILGFLIDRVVGFFHIPRETRTSLVLLGTLKNQANAGGLALTFFSQEAALPAAISSIVMMTYLVRLDLRTRLS